MSNSKYKKVLCVCLANKLRSPTMAWVLSNPPWNYNTRSCGIDQQSAIVLLSASLLLWADEIVCADAEHERCVRALLQRYGVQKKIVCLDIPDMYEYRDHELIALIEERYQTISDV